MNQLREIILNTITCGVRGRRYHSPRWCTNSYHKDQEVTWNNYSIHFPLVTKIANYVSDLSFPNKISHVLIRTAETNSPASALKFVDWPYQRSARIISTSVRIGAVHHSLRFRSWSFLVGQFSSKKRSPGGQMKKLNFLGVNIQFDLTSFTKTVLGGLSVHELQYLHYGRQLISHHGQEARRKQPHLICLDLIL